MIGDLPGSDGEQVAKSIGGLFVATDVREAKAVEKLVGTACDKFGALDIMFNNAGIGVVASLLDTSEELYLNTIRVDLDGVSRCELTGKVMVQQKRGTIVNAALVAGIRGSQGLYGATNAAKHGVVGLTRNAALEFAHAGVKVTAFAPGSSTRRWSRAHSAPPSRFAKRCTGRVR